MKLNFDHQKKEKYVFDNTDVNKIEGIILRDDVEFQSSVKYKEK